MKLGMYQHPSPLFVYISLLLIYLAREVAGSKDVEDLRSSFTSQLMRNYGHLDLLDRDQFSGLCETIGLNAIYDDSFKDKTDDVECNGTFSQNKPHCMVKCLGYLDIFDLYSVNGHMNNSLLDDSLSSIVYSLQNTHCNHVEVTVETPSRRKPTSAEGWGYSIAACSFVVFISNIGVFFGPCMKTRAFEQILIFCVALAVGTLACTGLMVLIPESLHLTADDNPIPGYHWKLATAMAGIYVFYITERIIDLLKSKKRQSADTELEATVALKEEPANGAVHGHSHGEKGGEIKTVAWTLLLGDALHNFSDGLAIGAAFTTDIFTGISVSMAVITEELPHELGDIAILLHSGMTMKRALLLNFLAAAIIFIGMIIGVVVGENTAANTYIFAFAGGLFIYIALTDMLPEMKIQAQLTETSGKGWSKKTVFFLQNLGLILGFTIVMLLVVFGSEINVQ